ncbi:4501_t:CDS:1 [Paraglomus brasilianum]|uniref:4501_t:CDS:1 n=1 Tax=Paraglomus brasilianum TaxID=144538 RepID=A0A9N8WB97_9GLOM|nr:4501_t:CDS:1 [Paraglomus brasilianum]
MPTVLIPKPLPHSYPLHLSYSLSHSRHIHQPITFPLASLPFDVLTHILSFAVNPSSSSPAVSSSLALVSRTFFYASIPHIWNHIYIQEPTYKILFSILHTPVEKLMYDYRKLVKSVTVCPVSISRMKPGGLIGVLEMVNEVLTEVREINVEDKLSFCHVCHVGGEATAQEVGSCLIPAKPLLSLRLDSDHTSFSDDLLCMISSSLTSLKKLSLNGINFTDEGIIEYAIPAVSRTLEEINIGVGISGKAIITGRSVVELLSSCYKLRSMTLEGCDLTDQDFFIDALPQCNLTYLYIGKTKTPFSSFSLQSLLSTCYSSLQTLILDIDHISPIVLLDIIIPLYRKSNLHSLHLISESWTHWIAHYPNPKNEHERRAKEAMWRWKLKAYWGLSYEMIRMVAEEVRTLRVFSILGENQLKRNEAEAIGGRAIKGSW